MNKPPSCYCPTCGQPTDKAQLVAVEVEHLIVACTELRISLDAMGAVDTRGAARLLGRSARTLERWRSEGSGPNYMRGGLVTYSLQDLSEFLVHSLRDSTRTKYW